MTEAGKSGKRPRRDDARMSRGSSARFFFFSRKSDGTFVFPPSGKTDDKALQLFVFSRENERLRLESAKGNLPAQVGEPLCGHGEHGAPLPVRGAEHPAFATRTSLSGDGGKIFRRRDLVLSFPGAIKYKGQERNASSGCLSAENRAGRYVYYLNFPSIFHRRAHS